MTPTPNKGSITLSTVAGWGLILITTVSGIFVSQVTATNNRVGVNEVQIAILQTQYENIDKKLDKIIELAKGKDNGLLVKAR